MNQPRLQWQSKLVLLLVLPMVAVDVIVKGQWWATQQGSVAIWTLGVSILLALITWKLRAATPGAAATGAAITCSLMFSTLVVPYEPWHTALVPVLAVSVLAFATTAFGRSQKERLGTAEARGGRSAAQVAANLGIAALIVGELGQTWIQQPSIGARHWFIHFGMGQMVLFSGCLAALAEAAADTVSSEAGQVFGGKPRMITTFQTVEPGADGALSLAGTAAGIVAAGLVSALGVQALRGDRTMFIASCAGAVFGFLFDSLLGATLEQFDLLNNDAVNFLSTGVGAALAVIILAVWR